MRSSRQLTWSALKILGLRPPLDFFDKIQNEDIVEIYNTDQVQIFRTLRFFELCSYDVASILMIPWYKLYGRSSQMEEIGLREMNDSLFSGTAAVPFDMPSHELSEIASAEMRVFEMRHRWRGPLMGRDANGNMSRQGIIMTSAAKRLR
jgi:hypothetical protein